jgi:Nitroreductase family
VREAALALVPVGDPEAELGRHGDRGYRLLQIATGIVVHRAALAAAALGLDACIHSDGTTNATDTALGLTGTGWTSQSMLLVGLPRPEGLNRLIP